MKKPEKGMYVPDDLLYTENHEWIRMIDDITGVCGLTDFSQHNLGDRREKGRVPSGGDRNIQEILSPRAYFQGSHRGRPRVPECDPGSAQEHEKTGFRIGRPGIERIPRLPVEGRHSHGYAGHHRRLRTGGILQV